MSMIKRNVDEEKGLMIGHHWIPPEKVAAYLKSEKFVKFMDTKFPPHQDWKFFKLGRATEFDDWREAMEWSGIASFPKTDDKSQIEFLVDFCTLEINSEDRRIYIRSSTRTTRIYADSLNECIVFNFTGKIKLIERYIPQIYKNFRNILLHIVNKCNYNRIILTIYNRVFEIQVKMSKQWAEQLEAEVLGEKVC